MIDKLILETVKRVMRGGEGGEESDCSSKIRSLKEQFKPIFTNVYTYPEYGKFEQIEESVERLTDIAVTLLAIVVVHELVNMKTIKELLTSGFLIREGEALYETQSLSLKPF